MPWLLSSSPIRPSLKFSRAGWGRWAKITKRFPLSIDPLHSDSSDEGFICTRLACPQAMQGWALETGRAREECRFKPCPGPCPARNASRCHMASTICRGKATATPFLLKLGVCKEEGDHTLLSYLLGCQSLKQRGCG